MAIQRSNFAGGSSDSDNGALGGADTGLSIAPGAAVPMIGYGSSENGAADNAVVTLTDPSTGAPDLGDPIAAGISADVGSTVQVSIALPDPFDLAAPGQFDPGAVTIDQGETTVAIPGNFAGEDPAFVSFKDMPIGIGDSSSAPANAGASAPVSAGSSSQTVTYQGSGLVFVNIYGAGVSAAYQNAIIAAENFYQSHITTSETLYFNFDTASGGFAGENQFYWIPNVS
jgi:hypothetical protein